MARSVLPLAPRRMNARLRKGVADGDLPAGADAGAVVGFYLTVIDGLALQAREGATRKALESTVRCAMRAWDGVVSGTHDAER